MIGGVKGPPVLATASTAPASSGLKPFCFIMGIVICPVVATLAAGEPDREPNSMDEKTAVLAGPPRYLPIQASARSPKKSSAPQMRNTEPNRMKPGTTLVTVPRIDPHMPSPLRYIQAAARG